MFTIPNDLVFSPCKVDGLFWKDFHVLLSYLGNPEELLKLKEEDFEKYAEVISCLVTFVKETETELFNRGYLKEIEVEQH